MAQVNNSTVTAAFTATLLRQGLLAALLGRHPCRAPGRRAFFLTFPSRRVVRLAAVGRSCADLCYSLGRGGELAFAAKGW